MDRFRPVPLVAGLCLVCIGLSGVLDDGGALPHPWWVGPSTALALAALAVAGYTVRSLLASGSVPNTAEGRSG